MKIVAIIQARMSSTRLPGKVLSDIAGLPMLARIISRISTTPDIHEIVIATTKAPEDDILVDWICTNYEKQKYFRGNEHDVLDRFYQCAKFNGADIVVRITADDPLKDAGIIQKAINFFYADPSLDYCSNTIKPSYPEGLDIEVFRYTALELAWKSAILPSEREHVTPYIWKNTSIFNVKNFEYERDLSEWRLTIDKPIDLIIMNKILMNFVNDPLVKFEQIIEYLDKNPTLLEINSGTIRNEGYFKSMNDEKIVSKIIDRRVYGNELNYLKEVLDSEFRSSKGSTMMRRLEETFAKRFGAKYAISFVNGTATMHAALEAWGIGPGDEVIVPPLTMSATTFAVLQANATPIFADVDLETFQISVSSIEKNITPNTRAIITVALYGLSPDMDPIMELANKHNLLVIEDNAECFLGTYKGRVVGTLGHCASFSFQSSKHLTSGEGGIVITNDLELAEKMRKVQSLGYAGVSATKGKITKKDIQDPDYSRHVTLGWNYRMPELCCAVALAQLENIDDLVGRRIKVAQLFEQASKGYEKWFIPQKVDGDYTSSFWTWVARINHPDITWHQFRDRFMELGGDGVYAAWKLTYLEPMFQEMNLLGRERFITSDNKSKYRAGLCPVAELLQGQLIQFKTNYWDLRLGEKQATILAATLKSFS